MNGVPDHPELLLRERAWLQALARQLVQPHEGADELAHDALTAAMAQPAPRVDGGLRGWLAAILRKQLAGRRRAEHRRRAREAMAARAEALPATLDTVARFEVQRGVADAVLALSEPYRTTVLMRFWEGLSPAAIAARMAVPVETVRTRLKRGLLLLRERLDRAHGGDRMAWMVPLAGMTLMTTSTKFVVGGIAVAAAAWLLIGSPWSPLRDVEVSAARPDADAVAAAVAPPAAGPVPAAAVPERAAERAAVIAAGEAPWLSVTGTVVDDATEAPLRDVPVRLAAWPDRGAVVVRTAADGTFTLGDVRPSGFEPRQVVVLGSDYAVARTDVHYDFRSEAPQVVAVGTLRLVRGTMFSGQVVDPEGRAVPDAELLLPLESNGYGPFRGPQHMLQRWASLGHADGDGRFRLAQPIAPERYHENLLFAVSGRGVGWCRFEAGKQRRESPGLVIRLRPTGGVRVVVEDSRGQPIAGAMVRALPRFGPLGIARRDFRQEVGGPESVRAWFAGRTDARGEVLLGQLPVGERDAVLNAGATEDDYDLCVEADGFPAQLLVAFDLLPGVEQRVAMRLVAAREVTVVVSVRDDLGAPIAGVLVELGGSRNETGTTDAAGQVELGVGFAPRLGVVASCAGHLQAGAVLEPGPDTTRMQTSLVLARTQRLDGRIVDQTGAAVTGVTLFVDQRVVGSTDALGCFRVDQFPMGSRRLDVAFGSEHEQCRWTGGQEPQHVDAAQGPVTIVMQRRPGAVDVRIAVVDAATGEPLEATEASLRLHHLESDLFFFPKRTQVGLGLVTSQGTPAGRWQLAVRTASGQRGLLEFTLTDGQAPVDLRLALPVPGTITGTLRFVGVPPPATVTLDVRHANVDRRAFVQYRYPGRWHVEASSQAVVDDTHGGTGSLRLQPAQNSSFRLDSADPTDDLVFTVRGEGVTGRATLRIGAGQTRELLVEVTAKGK